MSYGSENSDNQATKYPFYVTLDTIDGLMLGQHVYIETSTSLEADKMWLMRDYIVDADSDHPYVWVAQAGEAFCYTRRDERRYGNL